MANEIKKKKNSDLIGLLIGAGIFSVVLVVVDLAYGNMGALWNSWVAWPFAILHLAAIVLWIYNISNIDDPSNTYRASLIVVLALSIILVMAHRAGYVDDKMQKETIDQNKTEQLR